MRLPWLLAACLTAAIGTATNTTLVFSNAGSWRYFAAGPVPLATWTAVGFGDGTWRQGQAPLGYGTPRVKTVVASGFTTTYYRIAFMFGGAPEGTSVVKVSVTVWDGGVVYLNGREVARVNMPALSVIQPTTAAASQVNQDTAPAISAEFLVQTSALVLGRNVLAVEVHRGAGAAPQAQLAASVVLATVPTPTATASISVTRTRGSSPSLTAVPTGSSIGFTSVWKYHDGGADLGTLWRSPSLNDTAWKSGRGMLGEYRVV